jgi:nicotinamidase/pyrazinamidase
MKANRMKKAPDFNLNQTDALIIADIQNDFLPGGALPIIDGDQIIPILNEYAKIFQAAHATLVASRDWHPANHMSFVAQGGSWPPHCVQDTEGAKFNSNLKLPEGTLIVSKATDPKKEAYSVFDGTNLGVVLQSKGVKRIFIGGLATDYCVVNSVLDARRLGFEVLVLADATCGIDVKPGDVDRAFETMHDAGAEEVTLEDLPEVETLTGLVMLHEVAADKPLGASDLKKKARMRPRGSYKQIRRERG